MLRKLQEADAEEVAVLDGELFPDVCWNEGTIARETRLGWGLVAVENGVIVGYLMARFDSDLVDLIRIGVTEDWQGKGIGRALVREAIEKIAGRLMLTVRIENKPARSLYLSEGFVPMSCGGNSVIMMREEG